MVGLLREAVALFEQHHGRAPKLQRAQAAAAGSEEGALGR
jgi:hypothetical protein